MYFHTCISFLVNWVQIQCVFLLRMLVSQDQLKNSCGLGCVGKNIGYL